MDRKLYLNRKYTGPAGKTADIMLRPIEKEENGEEETG